MRKPTIFVSDQVLHKPACASKEEGYTAEKHVVLFTYKSVHDRVTHHEILSKVEMRNLSFLL